MSIHRNYTSALPVLLVYQEHERPSRSASIVDSPRHVNYCIRRTHQCLGLETRRRFVYTCMINYKNIKCKVQPVFGGNLLGGEFPFWGGDFQVWGETFPPKRPVCNTVQGILVLFIGCSLYGECFLPHVSWNIYPLTIKQS